MKLGTLDQPEKINPDRLHEEMKAALGDKYLSMDTGIKADSDALGFNILLRLTDDATEADQQTAEAVIAGHDPALLSVNQQRDKDRAEAYAHFIGFDFDVLRAQKDGIQTDTIIDLLQDIQKLMQGTE